MSRIGPFTFSRKHACRAAALTLILGLAWLVTGNEPGQVIDAAYEYGLKAQLIERFTRFIEWPPESSVADPELPFVIAVIGDNPFDPYLKQLAAERKIKSKTVEVWEVRSAAQLKDPNLLFICRSEEDRLAEILSFAADKPVLTVGDTKGFAHAGVHINLFLEEGSVRFEINTEAARKSGLQFSSKLLRLARIVAPEEVR
jgi:hypothetical protein